MMVTPQRGKKYNNPNKPGNNMCAWFSIESGRIDIIELG